MYKIWIQPQLQFNNLKVIEIENTYSKCYCNICGTKLEKTKIKELEYVCNVIYDKFDFIDNSDGYFMQNKEFNLYTITQLEETPYILNKISEEFFKDNANIELYFDTDQWKSLIEFFNKYNIPFEKKLEIHIEADNKQVEYEKYIDDCYYHYWAVRPIGDNNFNSPNLKHFLTEKESDDYINEMIKGL